MSAPPSPPSFTARLEPAGAVFDAPVSLPLLHAAELAARQAGQAQGAGVVWPSSCRNGTCRTCICRLLSGQVSYRIEWPGLSLDEKREGYILPCVAYPTSDVVIEWPA